MLNLSQYIQLAVNPYHRLDSLQVLHNKSTIMVSNGDNLEKVNRMLIRVALVALNKKVDHSLVKMMSTVERYQDK